MSVYVGGGMSPTNLSSSRTEITHFFGIPNSNQHKVRPIAEVQQTLNEYLLTDGLHLWQGGSILLFFMCTSIQVSQIALSRKSLCDFPSSQTYHPFIKSVFKPTGSHSIIAAAHGQLSPWRTARFLRKFSVTRLLCPAHWPPAWWLTVLNISLSINDHSLLC